MYVKHFINLEHFQMSSKWGKQVCSWCLLSWNKISSLIGEKNQTNVHLHTFFQILVYAVRHFMFTRYSLKAQPWVAKACSCSIFCRSKHHYYLRNSSHYIPRYRWQTQLAKLVLLLYENMRNKYSMIFSFLSDWLCILLFATLFRFLFGVFLHPLTFESSPKYYYWEREIHRNKMIFLFLYFMLKIESF